jgi:hypothetical protein
MPLSMQEPRHPYQAQALDIPDGNICHAQKKQRHSQNESPAS